jgi:hypothetical protein
MRAALVVLALCGCSTASSLSTGFLDRDTLKVDPVRFPDAAAVILYRSDKYLMQVASNDWTEQQRHVAIAVLKEGGFDLAEVRIPFGNRQELVSLTGRVIQPDGRVVEISPKDVLSDTNGKGERDTQARFFRFPDVRVGSVLEYEWVISTPWIIGADDQDTLGDFPVLKYDFELIGSRQLVFETIEYNSTRPIDVTQLNDGRHRLRFSLENLPARETEEWMPHWTFTEPRWSWRVLGYKVSSMVTNNWYRTWADVVEGFAKRAYVDATVFKDLSERPDLSGCVDARCKVEKARTWIMEKTTTLGVNVERESDLGAAFKSGKASSKERAMILRKVLEEAGVEARLAFSTLLHSRQTAQSFPEWDQFNRLLVYVPAQASIDKPLALDLEPEYCKTGELTVGLQGQPAFLFWMVGGTVGAGEAEGEWITLEGPACAETFSHERITAKLESSGALQARVEHVWAGELAEQFEQRKINDSPSDFRQRVQDRATSISPLARTTDARWHACVARSGQCGFGFAVDARQYAVKSGPNWLVPLSLSNRAFDSLRQAERQHDIHISSRTGTEIEEIDIEGPPGFHAAALPDVVADAVPGLAIRLTAERTPRGAKLVKRVTLSPGIYPKEHIARLRPLIDKVRAWRNTVLTFEPD